MANILWEHPDLDIKIVAEHDEFAEYDYDQIGTLYYVKSRDFDVSRNRSFNDFMVGVDEVESSKRAHLLTNCLTIHTGYREQVDAVWVISREDAAKEWMPSDKYPTVESWWNGYTTACADSLSKFFCGENYGVCLLFDGETVESVWGFIGEPDESDAKGNFGDDASLCKQYRKHLIQQRKELNKKIKAAMCAV